MRPALGPAPGRQAARPGPRGTRSGQPARPGPRGTRSGQPARPGPRGTRSGQFFSRLGGAALLVWVVAGALLALGGLGPARAAGGTVVRDHPNDRGDAVLIEWRTGAGGDSVRIERGETAEGPWRTIAVVSADSGSYRDGADLARGRTYHYRVDGQRFSVVPSAQWFDSGRTNLLLILLLYLGLILLFLNIARRGGSLFIRKIAGLDAMEEAIGRATEMGKPVLYVPGIDDASNIQTIYSMAILNSVSKMVAKYDTELIVPLAKAFVVPLAEETVRSGYLDAGRPESFRADNIRFLSDEQFAFTAAVNGIMLRERPAANLFLGSFFAESLVLAETGFTTGAIQIAGTANIHQLPFFVVACDYTMIGEEFFATSAYLSREPMLVGTLKGGDMMKLLIMIFLLVSAVGATLGYADAFRNLLVIR